MPQDALIRQIIEQLTTLQKEGQQVVPIEAVNRALEGLPPDHANSLEARKIQFQADIETFKVRSTAKVETFRSVVDTAKSALATIILINGGATVALLTFIGNLAKAGAAMPHTPKALLVSTGCFAAGVLLGALATGGLYMTQSSFNEEFPSRGWKFRSTTIFLALLALCAFAAGVIAALDGFAS